MRRFDWCCSSPHVDEFVAQTRVNNLWPRNSCSTAVLYINSQRFRDGLVFKAHRLCLSLNPRLEGNKEKDEVLCGSTRSSVVAGEGDTEIESERERAREIKIKRSSERERESARERESDRERARTKETKSERERNSVVAGERSTER